MNKKIKRFIAQQGSGTTVRVFLAETGQLYRVLDVGGSIVSSPICTESELAVSVQTKSGRVTKIFSVPSFSLKNIIPN